MKKTIAWFLLTTYCCACCTALAPIVQDVAAHLFWHKTHIEHVHHGQKNEHHLALEMAALMNENPDRQAIFGGVHSDKPALSAHLLTGPFSPIVECTAGQNTAFPMADLCLPKGIKASVFLPPELG